MCCCAISPTENFKTGSAGAKKNAGNVFSFANLIFCIHCAKVEGLFMNK